MLGVENGEVEAGVVRPLLRAGFRVEGDDAAERGAEVERATEQDRRRLERALSGVDGTVRHIACPVCPRDFERAHVVARDLRERRVAGAAGITAVRVPAGDRPAVVERDGARASSSDGDEGEDRHRGAEDEEAAARTGGHGSAPNLWRDVSRAALMLGCSALCGNAWGRA